MLKIFGMKPSPSLGDTPDNEAGRPLISADCIAVFEYNCVFLKRLDSVVEMLYF